MAALSTLGWRASDDDRRAPLERCRAVLRREGFTVSWAFIDRVDRGPRPPDLMAANGPRTVRVFVLLDGEIDAAETRERVRAAARDGETRLWVPWPLRWLALSNLDRWGVQGVPVLGW